MNISWFNIDEREKNFSAMHCKQTPKYKSAVNKFYNAMALGHDAFAKRRSRLLYFLPFFLDVIGLEE